MTSHATAVGRARLSVGELEDLVHGSLPRWRLALLRVAVATDVRERGLRPPSDAGTAGEFLARATIIVPDFIPVAGQLDDAIVVALALRWLLRGVDPAVLDELWPGPPAGLNLLKRAAGLGRRSTESPTD